MKDDDYVIDPWPTTHCSVNIAMRAPSTVV